MRVPVPDETVLGLLAAEPQHGYQLLAHFRAKEELGQVWTLSRSQLYAVLRRLEEQGAIRGQDVVAGNTPTRRVYSLTEQGHKQLNEWLYEVPPSASMRLIRVQFISRLFIARLLGWPVEPLIERQKATCVAQYQKFMQARQNAASATEQLVLDFVIGQLESALEWLDACHRYSPIFKKHEKGEKEK